MLHYNDRMAKLGTGIQDNQSRKILRFYEMMMGSSGDRRRVTEYNFMAIYLFVYIFYSHYLIYATVNGPA